MKTAEKQLRKLITVTMMPIIMMIFSILMGLAMDKILAFIFFPYLFIIFTFRNTCKTTLQSIKFVFFTHPLDIGDRCVIHGVQVIVEEINIQTTVFLTSENWKIYYPNAVLATKPITSISRIPDMRDSVLFSINSFTSARSIASLKTRIESFIESKPQHWEPNHSLVIRDGDDENELNMALYVNHVMSSCNITARNQRRSELIIELTKIIKDISLQNNADVQSEDHIFRQ